MAFSVVLRKNRHFPSKGWKHRTWWSSDSFNVTQTEHFLCTLSPKFTMERKTFHGLKRWGGWQYGTPGVAYGRALQTGYERVSKLMQSGKLLLFEVDLFSFYFLIILSINKVSKNKQFVIIHKLWRHRRVFIPVPCLKVSAYQSCQHGTDSGWNWL